MKSRALFDVSVLWWISCIVLIASFLMSHFLNSLQAAGQRDLSHQLEYWKLSIDVIKIGVSGIIVACLGILIPNGFAVARDNFNKKRDARLAFSRAKTGVYYLSLRVGVLPLSEAVAYLNKIHIWKHRVELYRDELREFLDHRDEKATTTGMWAELLFNQLHAVRDTLVELAFAWDDMNVDDRIRAIHDAQIKGFKKWETGNLKPSRKAIDEQLYQIETFKSKGDITASAQGAQATSK